MSKLKDVMDILYKDKSVVSASTISESSPIPTPSPSVNWAMGGGITPGYLHCFSGPESSGKSFFAMACASELLKTDPEGIILWFDAEFSFSKHWLDVMVSPDDHDRIIIKRTNRGIDIFDYYYDTIIGLVENKGLKVLGCVLDSLQSIVAVKEAKRANTEKIIIGDLASYMPGALKKILQPSRVHNIPWIIISQVRQDLDPGAKYKGRTLVTTGGMAFKHHIDIEVFFEKIWSKDSKIYGSTKNMNDKAEQMGHSVRAKIWKGRGVKPHRVAEFKLHYEQGIVQTDGEMVHLASNLGVITRKGSNYYFEGQLLGNGKDKTTEMVAASPDLQKSIMEAVSKAVSTEACADDVMLAEAEDELGDI